VVPPGDSQPQPPRPRQTFTRRQIHGNLDGVARRPVAPRVPPVPVPEQSENPLNIPVTPPTAPQQPVSQPEQPPAPQPQAPQQAQSLPHLPVQAVTEQSNPKAKRLTKPSSKLLKITGVFVAIVVIALGVVAFISWQAKQSDSVTLLRDGLNNSLSLQHVSVSSQALADTRNAKIDFSNAQNPLTSSEGTAHDSGDVFKVATYGTKQVTYLSYAALPPSISPQISNSIKGSWIQLRNKPETVIDTDSTLPGIAEPGNLIFGPVILGNYPDLARKQIVNYLLAHKVYALQQPKAIKGEFHGQKVYILPVKIDSNYLRVSIESAAAAIGLKPTDIGQVVDHMGELQAASAKLYVSAKGHHIVRFTGNHFDYSYKFDDATVASEPQTHVNWQNFAPVQLQIEAQAATKLEPTALDVARKGDLYNLHTVLAQYYAQNNRYPAFNEMSDKSWLTGLQNAPKVSQRDPLAATTQLAAAPKANTYAYVPVPASGKGNCDNKAAACVHYKLIATLSNGQNYTVQDP
jgi:hypothetical protein